MDSLLRVFDSVMTVEPSTFFVLAFVIPTLVLGAAWMGTRAMRGASAGARHLVWLTSALVLLFYPLACALAPKWHILPAGFNAQRTTVAASHSRDMLTDTSMSSRVGANDDRSTGLAEASDESSPSNVTSEFQGRRRRIAPALGSSIQEQQSRWHSATQLGWAVALAIWSVGVLIGITWIAGAAFMLWRASHQWTAVHTGRLAEMLGRLRTEMGLGRSPRLYQSESHLMPFTFGIRRFAIVLPAASEIWNPDRTRAVLLHELAHIRRSDSLSQLAMQLVCILYWFHPLVWLARRRLRAEAERACDDVALSAGICPVIFAEQLLYFGSLTNHNAPLVHAIPMAVRSDIGPRIEGVLDESRNHRTVMRGIHAATTAVALCAGAPLAILRPNLAAQEATIDESETLESSTFQPAMRFGATPKLGADAAISDFKLTADGRIFASAGLDTILAWDQKTGKRTLALGVGDQIRAIAVSPDGSTLAAHEIRSGKVDIWNVAERKKVASMDVRPGPDPNSWHSTDLDFSPDGSLLASAGEDGTVRIWNVSNGNVMREMRGTEPLAQVVFIEEGARLISATRESGVIRVWDAQTGEQRDEWSYPDRTIVFDMAVTPDDIVLAIASHKDLLLRNLTTEAEIAIERPGEPHTVFAVTATPDSESWVTISRPASAKRSRTEIEVSIWEAKTGKFKRRLDGLPPTGSKIAVTSDGRYLATHVQWEGRVRLWDLATGEEKFPHSVGHSGAVRDIDMSADGKIIATAGSDARVCIWDATTGDQTRAIDVRLATGGVSASQIALHSNGTQVAVSGGWDDTVTVFDTQTGRQLHDHLVGGLDQRLSAGELLGVTQNRRPPRPLKITMGDIRYTRDGKRLVAVGIVPNRQARIREWDAQSGEVVVEHNVRSRTTSNVYRGVLSREGDIFATFDRGRASLLDVERGEVTDTLDRAEGIVGIAFSPDGESIVTVCADGKLRILDRMSLELNRTIPTFVPSPTLGRPGFSPDGKRFFAIVGNRETQRAILWDTATWQRLADTTAEALHYRCFAFSQDGKQMAVGLASGQTLLWDIENFIQSSPATVQ